MHIRLTHYIVTRGGPKVNIEVNLQWHAIVPCTLGRQDVPLRTRVRANSMSLQIDLDVDLGTTSSDNIVSQSNMHSVMLRIEQLLIAYYLKL